LLVDGVNELPSEEARRELHKFRQDYQKTTPMIFTTRDLGVGGDLGITKKLEMQPLSEPQMQQFVCAYLPQQGEQMLRQLGSRLREFGQTPLLLWMLCSLFKAMGKVPSNLGLVFRQFALSYDRKLKQDVPISKESRRWLPRLLEQLAWVMTSGEARTELQVAIPRQQAEAVLTECLQGKVAHPEDYALCWLEDLLNHHLIQLGAGDQIEFRHQLIQEYYTAECLLKLLPSLSNDELKLEYLNYLKWTEPLALMLELVEDEAQAVRVVKLALEVDLRLGARLAGAVKPELQERTVGLVVELEIPQLLKIELLGVTRSCNSIPTIRQALEEKDWIIRWIATRALGTIGSEATVPALAQAVNDEESSVRLQAIEALEKVGTEVIVPALSQAVNDEEPSVRLQVVNALETVGNDSAIYNLLNAWTDENPEIRFRTLSVLGQITGKDKISTLVQYLTERGFKVQSTLYSSYLRDEIFSWSRQKPQPIAYVYSPLDALEKIGESPTIHTLCQALVDENPSVRRSAVYRLKQFDSELTIPLLLQALQDEDSHVCLNAFSALKEIAVPGVLPYLYERILIATSPNFLDELFGVTSAIQQRCKFYNYTIATSPPPQDESKVEHLAAPIDMQQYEEILSVISNMVTVMERNEKSFQGIKEEALRDHFLVQLNGKYKGQATGETFNKKGRPDILIRVEGENIFIAECKFWRGKNKLKETLDQLLGYTTWRDTKLAMLIFNRNKNFTAVRQQIPEVMKNHPTFTQELFYPSETGFRFILHHPEDKNRELLLTVLAFEIPR